VLVFSGYALASEVTFVNSDVAGSQLDQENTFLDAAGLGNPGIGNIASTIITTLLSLLGVIFITLTIYAGFLWMTAQGNDQQVEKAMSIIKKAVIGFLIIMSAYSITYFVFRNVPTGGDGSAPAAGI